MGVRLLGGWVEGLWITFMGSVFILRAKENHQFGLSGGGRDRNGVPRFEFQEDHFGCTLKKVESKNHVSAGTTSFRNKDAATYTWHT